MICNLLAIDFTFKIVLVDFFVSPDICRIDNYLFNNLMTSECF
jgi:hypothetical protein